MSTTNAELSATKIAIVTGGSRGLGRKTVINLPKRGVHSIFTYNSNRAEADKVIAAVTEAGAKATALQLDTGNVSSFDAFVKSVTTALAGFGVERFDYLVNNAGTSHHNAFEKTTEKELDSLYNVITTSKTYGQSKRVYFKSPSNSPTTRGADTSGCVR